MANRFDSYLRRLIFSGVIGLSILSSPANGNSDGVNYFNCQGSLLINEKIILNHSETFMLHIRNDARKKLSRMGGKSFGILQFSTSTEPLRGSNTLNVCFEDALNFYLEPTCILDNIPWPDDVVWLNRRCRLDKVSLKFDCNIIVYGSDRQSTHYNWNLNCDRINCILCK